LGFLGLCGGQCVRTDDGCAEQRTSATQFVSQYVADNVAHYDQIMHERKQRHSNGIGSGSGSGSGSGI
jgi:hypothetical protein